MGEPINPLHTLVPCWMPEPLIAFKEQVYMLFRPSYADHQLNSEKLYFYSIVTYRVIIHLTLNYLGTGMLGRNIIYHNYVSYIGMDFI